MQLFYIEESNTDSNHGWIIYNHFTVNSRFQPQFWGSPTCCVRFYNLVSTLQSVLFVEGDRVRSTFLVNK